MLYTTISLVQKNKAGDSQKTLKSYHREPRAEIFREIVYMC